MTSEQILTTTDLNYLYSLWNDSQTPDDVRMDCATQIDRVEKYRKEKAKDAYNENEQPIIKNEKYGNII